MEAGVKWVESRLSSRGDFGFRLQMDDETRTKVVEAVYDCCTRNPGTFLKIHAFGARARRVPSSMVCDSRVGFFCESEDTECLRASIANGMDCISTHDAVRLL